MTLWSRIMDCWWRLIRFFHPSREFFTHMETSPLPVINCKVWPMFGAYGHWAVTFFSVPHLLWHGASLCNGHLWGSLTLTPVPEHLSVDMSLPFFNDLGLSRLGFEHPAFRLQGQPLTHCATAAACWLRGSTQNTLFLWTLL